MSAEQVKASFDKAAVDIKQHINEVIAPVVASTKEIADFSVLHVAQSLTESQQEQARLNIGAADRSVVDGLCDYFDNGILVLSDYKTSGKCRIAADNRKLTVFHQGTDATRTLLTDEDGSRILEEAIAGRVLYTPQTLDVYQKEQARQNIGAICMRDLRDGIEFEDGKTMGGYFNLRVFNSKLEGYDATKKKTYTFLTDADEERLINATLAALPVYNGEVSEA